MVGVPIMLSLFPKTGSYTYRSKEQRQAPDMIGFVDQRLYFSAPKASKPTIL